MLKQDYKKLCDDLSSQLKQQYKMMEDMAAHSDKLHIVKFVVNEPDQFILDGEFVADDYKVMYKGQPVSTSEAVMFKAGKESACREFDILSAHQDMVIAEMSKEMDRLKEELAQEKAYSQQLHDSNRRNLESKSKEIEELSEAHAKQLVALRESMQLSENQISNLKAQLEAFRYELSVWRNGEVPESALPIHTPYGIYGGNV